MARRWSASLGYRVDYTTVPLGKQGGVDPSPSSAVALDRTAQADCSPSCASERVIADATSSEMAIGAIVARSPRLNARIASLSSDFTRDNRPS